MPVLGTSSAHTFFSLLVLASVINGLLVGSPIQIGSPFQLVSSSTKSATVVSTSQTSSLSLASPSLASNLPLASTSQTSGLSLASSSITEQPTASSTASTGAPKASTASVEKLQHPYSGNGPISSGPVEGPSQEPGTPSDPGGPDPTIPQALKSASELLAPAQSTKEAQNAPQEPKAAKESSTTPQGSSSSDPETQSTDTPQVNSPSEPQAETEAPETPQAGSPSEPQAETQAPSVPQVDSPSEPQAETQAPSVPQVDSPSEPQAETQAPSVPQVDSPSEPQAGAKASDTQAESTSQPQGETSAPGSTSDGPGSSPIQAQAEAGPVLTVGSSTYAYNIDSSSNLIIASQTAQPGGPAIPIGGVEVALVPSANSIVVAGSDVPVQTQPPNANALFAADNEVVAPGAKPQFTVGNEVITPNSASQFVIAGQTVVPGASALTIDGTPISIAPSATQVVVGGSTIGLQSAKETGPPTLKVNGQIITANSASQFVIGGQTITPGAPAVTISGTPISIPWISQQTQPIQGIMTAGYKAYPYTLNSAGDIILASQTLVPGGQAITVGGETISESPDGSGIVVVSGGSTRTEALSQMIGPTASFRSNGSFTFPAFTGFNSSTTSRSGTAAGSATITPTTPASASPIHPTSVITANARKDSGTSRSKISVNLILAFLVACIFWCG